jgi:mRNA interferase YafQ
MREDGQETKLKIRLTNQFKKDTEKIKRRGKDLDKLYDIVEKLANLEPLAEKLRDHALVGGYADCRECHIAPDWLLIYRIEDEELVLVLTRTGSHSDLF